VRALLPLAYRARPLKRRLTCNAVAFLVLGFSAAPASAEIPSGTSSLANADVRLVGDVADQEVGFHVEAAGDLDDDGFEDIIVGAYRDPTVGPAAGAAYVIYGPVTRGAIDLADADAKLEAEFTGDFAAEGFAGGMDLDDDGFDDFVIGAPGRFPPAQPGLPAPGAAYVFYGGEERLAGTMSLADADAKLVGESAVDFAGLSVAGATDLDDDGFDDLVTSASLDDAGGSAAGAVYVLYGGEERLTGTMSLVDADAKLVGAAGEVAGFRLGRAGDFDDDGSEDLLIGAPAITGFGGSGTGSTYLVYGSRNRLTGTISLPTIGVRLVGEEADDRPGIGLTGAGDVDDDGVDDVLVGTDLEDTAGTSAGSAYLFYGREERLTGTVNLGTADAKLVGEAAGDQAGLDVAMPGDLDRDRFDDLVIGAGSHDATGVDAGAAYVFFGGEHRLSGALTLASADAKLLGEAPGDLAGQAVGPAGDVNDDRVDDLMIGARRNDAGGTNAGTVYVFLGEHTKCGRGHAKNHDKPGHRGKHPCDFSP
jgi:FG-GAP repeat